jgi:trimeric autotransporter adhesin
VCARGDGIRRSKDLRAEIEKYSNSTNERKKMSIKTIRKRIALVAVSTLTASLFAVVSAPVAKAESGAWLTPASMILVTQADTDGTPDVNTAGALASETPSTAATSVGWVSNTSSSSTNTATYAVGSTTVGTSITSGVARTGVVLSGAKLGFIVTSATASTTTVGVSVVVTGGTLGSLVTTSNAINLAGTQTSASIFTNQVAGNQSIAGVFNVSAAAGSTATIAAYSGTGITGTTTRTAGDLIGIWTLTVASASASGVYSAADSTVTQQPCIQYSEGSTATNAFDTTSRCANGRVGVVYVSLVDAYAAAVTGGTLTATVTGGSVNVANVYSTVSGDNYGATSAFDSATATSRNYVLVTQPTANTAGSSTVTITYNGTVVGTKTINWGGDVASIAVDPANSATVIGNGVSSTTSGTSYALNVVYVYKDAAGNVLSGLTPTLVDATGSMIGATLSTSTETTITVPQSSTLGYGASTINHPGGSATANFGAGSYRIQVLNAAGSAVKSNVVNVTVASTTTHTFTASFDKASYVPGDFATLTIEAKDSGGRLMPTGKTIPGLVITLSSGLTATGTVCDSSSTFKAGIKKCTFAVGNTAGAYSWSVALTNGASQDPVTGSVKVTDGAVSNADVLKSIVALIASINKQIQALQKLILKR